MVNKIRGNMSMFKRLAIITTAATMLAATPVYAGQWMQDSNGWWWQNDDGNYPFMAWAWIDGNHDGIAENYFFDERGYLNMNPVDQGLVVDENGALIYNGAVCTAVLPDGKDYEMGMAVDGKRVNWVYHETEDSILRRQEAEEKAAKAASRQENPLEDIDPYELANRIADLVNEERESRGKDALEINDELMENAMVRAEEADEKFSHTRPDGSYYDTIIIVAHSSSGENLAGRGDLNAYTVDDFAKKAVDGWLSSSGHKKNMMDSRWKETGVGVYITDYGYTVSQLFIK